MSIKKPVLCCSRLVVLLQSTHPIHTQCPCPHQGLDEEELEEIREAFNLFDTDGKGEHDCLG